MYNSRTKHYFCTTQLEAPVGVIVSGSRDGSIMVWDTRCTGKGSSQKPINIIHSAHEKEGRRQNGRNKATCSASSVTAVLFHGDKIASCGTSDG